VFDALAAEMSQPAPEKGRVEVALEGDCLVIRVHSGTLSGLRALLNSFLYLAYAAYGSLKNSERRR
jgi:tRNA threonylcarbamoyladenosine modification (KEOPS) complex  Pcc1 subunit